MEIKNCTSCKQTLEASFENFHKSSSGKYGLAAKCKSCYKKYYEENKERISDRGKVYFQNNKEMVKERHKKWRTQNSEYLLNKSKKYYLANKMTRVKYNREYSVIKAEKRIVAARQWRNSNKERSLEHSIKRRMLQNKVIDTLTEKQWQDCLVYFNHCCAYCGTPDKVLEKEHFVPLENNGPTTVYNIVPSCRRCNVRKRSIDFFEWYPTHEYYLEDRKTAIITYIDHVRH